MIHAALLQIPFPSIPHWLSILLLILLGLFILWLIHKIIFRTLRAVSRRFKGVNYDTIRSEFYYPSFFLLLALAAWMARPLLIDYEEQLATLNHILQILTIFITAWFAIGVVEVIKDSLLSYYAIHSKDNLQARKINTQFRVFASIIDFLIILIAFGLVLMSFEKIRQLGISLLASAGLAGVIVGLAAQKVIGTLLAGLQIALTQPIRIDDVVIVEKEWGRIEEITLTYVVIRIWDKRRLVVPTTYFIEKPFQNWTRVSAEILGTVFLYTDYGVPLDAIREKQTQILQETELWDGKVNVVQVTNSTEKTMEIRLLVSAKDSATAWDLRVFLREQMIQFLQKEYPEHLPQARVALSQNSQTSQHS